MKLDTFFLKFIALWMSFYKMPIQVFCFFFFWLYIRFQNLIFKVSLRDLDNILLWDMWIAIIFHFFFFNGQSFLIVR